jgi:hypothetical protein
MAVSWEITHSVETNASPAFAWNRADLKRRDAMARYGKLSRRALVWQVNSLCPG